jgi:periplasmic divalent cation tolerance protein
VLHADLVRVVLCNCPPDAAPRIARALVERRLAACVSTTPVTSTYRWQGQISVDPEVTLVIKVGADRLPELREQLKAMHPYQLPEIVALSVDTEASLAPYVDWVRAESSEST